MKKHGFQYKGTVASVGIGSALGGLSSYLDAKRINKDAPPGREKVNPKKAAMWGALGGGTIGGIYGYHLDRTPHHEEPFSGNWNNQRYRPKAAPVDHRPHLSALGLSGNEKTKKQVKDLYRQLAMKHHPDRGGDGKRMQQINNAFDQVKKSDWFNKLATFARGFSYVARG